MFPQKSLVSNIFSLQDNSGSDFKALALDIFRYQAEHCEPYKHFLEALGINGAAVVRLEEIPFLPIEFFKTHKVLAEGMNEEVIFTSSGTTGMQTSKHHVADIELYETSFNMGFQHFYGKPDDYCILALLPSYLERSGSSLIYMARKLIEQSKHPDSGFYLDDLKGLASKLNKLNRSGQKCLLLGVSFALLDLAEQYPQDLKNITIMETGGMKGQRKELVREDLHTVLKEAFGVEKIHSEYGMTELLSQAYSKGDGLFSCPPWIKVRIRDVNDPLAQMPNGKTGGINIIDLANIYSCSFIATKDLGRVSANGNFEVLGRFDNSDVRGCNLMVF